MPGIALLIGQQSARVNHPLVGLFKQAPFLNGQGEAVALVINRLDPRKQSRVQSDAVAMRGQFRADLDIDRIEPFGRVGASELVKNAAHASKHAA